MSILTCILATPLIAAVVLMFVPRNYRVVMRGMAVLATLVSALLALIMFVRFDSAQGGSNGFKFESQVPWISSVGISYHVGVDGINVGLVLMGAIVAFAAACVSGEIREREKEFYILLLVMAGGILGAFASLDLFLFYFFHELALVPTFIMIGVWGRGPQKNYATFQITLYLSIGALVALAGLIGLYLQAGAATFDIPELVKSLSSSPISVGAQRFIFPLLLFGFGILISLWPFHTWAPLGYGSAPSPTAMLHAGVLKKFGLYGLIRIALPLLPDAARSWAPVVAWLCLGNLVYCGWVAMRQKDFNWLAGYSSVAHMGFVFLGIASLNVVGVSGAILVMIAHGFLAALIFGLNGYIYQQTGTLEIQQLGGLFRRLPFIGVALMMTAFAGCGLPGFANFVGEISVLFGAWKVFPVVTILAIWGASIVGAVYMLRAIRSILQGPLPERWSQISDASNPWRRLPFVLLLAGLLAFGFFPRLLTDKLTPSVTDLVARFSVPASASVSPRNSTPDLLSNQVFASHSAFRTPHSAHRIPHSMNPLRVFIHEWLVVALALVVLLADLWVPVSARRKLGYVGVLGLGAVLLYSLLFVRLGPGEVVYAGGGMYALDGLALFFKRFFLAAALLVLLLSIEFTAFEAAIAEYYALLLFALTGMLFAASANNFALLFVSLELITITFYILTSFQRSRITSLEAGVKYLIIGALSTGFTVFGIALVFGVSGTLDFVQLAVVSEQLAGNRIFLFGLLLVLVGLGFKIAAFPFQIWAPDVYQGAPTPTTAFLAIGSKAAGFVLLLRLLFLAVPSVTHQWGKLLIVISAITILYGNLCAIPQRNLKRLLGYSSIAHAGYMLLGIAALSAAGEAAVLFYLSGYLFTVLAAFTVICLVMQHVEGEDISALAGLNQRSPLLALTMTIAMVSLAGIPPLAGFFGKFLLFKAAIAAGAARPAYYWLVGIAIFGVVISLYYYFGVVRAIFWSRPGPDVSPVSVSPPLRFSLYVCLLGMFLLGLYPNPVVNIATAAVARSGTVPTQAKNY